MKTLGFSSGHEFTHWMQNNGIMKNNVDIERIRIENIIKNSGCETYKEYKEMLAQRLGFENNAERDREWTHDTGRNLPKEINEDCPSYFGDFTESLMIQTFEDAKRIHYGNPGFDCTCKKGYKMDNKSKCLYYNIDGDWSGWTFPIRFNNIAEWFILSA